LDKIDRKIINYLQRQPTLTVGEIAERVGLSQTPCWRRIKRLEENGIILGRAVLLDAKKLGLGIEVLAELRLGKHDEATLEALESQVQTCDEIISCYSMSGDSDYVVRIVAQDIEAYEHFLKKILLHLPGVSGVNSRFVLKHVKQTTVLPLS
jgi:Lrp/AsnC family transcriptional regulator